MTAADPIAFLLALLETDAPGTDLEDVPIRVGRIENDDLPPVVLLEDAGWIGDRYLPVLTPARVSITAYGRSESEASSLLLAARTIYHGQGPRVIDGTGMWKAFDETGPQPRDDPDTHWSARFVVAAIYMPSVVLEAS